MIKEAQLKLINKLVEKDFSFSVKEKRKVIISYKEKVYSITFDDKKVVFNIDRKIHRHIPINIHIPINFHKLDEVFDTFLHYIRTGEKECFVELVKEANLFTCPICGKKYLYEEKINLVYLEDKNKTYPICKHCYCNVENRYIGDEATITFYKYTGCVPLYDFDNEICKKLRIYKDIRMALDNVYIPKEETPISPIYSKKYSDAILNLSKAIGEIVDLSYDCSDDIGRKFTDEILNDKMWGLFALSMDEMVGTISNLAYEMEEAYSH